MKYMKGIRMLTYKNVILLLGVIATLSLFYYGFGGLFE